MPQITGAMTINDGAATPVAKSFAPVAVAPDNSVFAEKSAGTSAGYKQLSYGLSMASASRPTNRVSISLNYPVLQTVNGVSTVAYVGRFKGDFVVPDVMTAAERADLHAFVANGLAHANIKAAVKDLDPSY
jgi:hypothetical protein